MHWCLIKIKKITLLLPLFSLPLFHYKKYVLEFNTNKKFTLSLQLFSNLYYIKTIHLCTTQTKIYPVFFVILTFLLLKNHVLMTNVKNVAGPIGCVAITPSCPWLSVIYQTILCSVVCHYFLNNTVLLSF